MKVGGDKQRHERGLSYRWLRGRCRVVGSLGNGAVLQSRGRALPNGDVF